MNFRLGRIQKEVVVAGFKDLPLSLHEWAVEGHRNPGLSRTKPRLPGVDVALRWKVLSEGVEMPSAYLFCCSGRTFLERQNCLCSCK